MATGGQRAEDMEPADPQAGALAHDFNNLLTVILGCGESLTAELDDPRQRRLAALILQAAERGAEVIRTLCAIETAGVSAGPIETPAGGDELILVVEDDDLVREHVCAELERLGYRLLIAANGGEALALLAARDDIDLLFTDVLMPGGMDGRELGEQALGRRPSLRLLLTSGHCGEVPDRDGRLRDGRNLLSKPYGRRRLAEMVRRALDEIPEVD